jgi:hypothetical protein
LDKFYSYFHGSEFYKAVAQTEADRKAKGFTRRHNFFTYRDLWIWIDNPYEMPPNEPEIKELCLRGI